MSELNSYRDNAWYIRQSNLAADRALHNNDQIEALKFRTIALDVMMLPIARMTAVNKSSMDRLIEHSNYDIEKHRRQIALLRELSGAIETLPADNNATVKIDRARVATPRDEPTQRSVVGTVSLGYETTKHEHSYTTIMQLIGRSSVSAANLVDSMDAITLMEARYTATSDGIKARVITEPPLTFELIVNKHITKGAI